MTAVAFRLSFAAGLMALVFSPRFGSPSLPWTSGNLVVNGGAEIGAAAVDSASIVRPYRWATKGHFTALAYSVEGVSGAIVSDAIGGGDNLFAGGPANRASSASQVLAIPVEWVPLVRRGLVYAKLFAALGGWQTQPDSARVVLHYLDAAGTSWGTLALGPVTVRERRNSTAVLPLTVTGKIPSQTRRIRVVITATAAPGPYNWGLADNVALYLVQ